MTALPFSHLVLVLVQLTLLGGTLMFFRPLLVGIARALVLVVRPRPTKDELAARRKLRAAKLAAQSVPSAKDSVDVRSLASRG
jgi:hypothetical protein